MAMLGSSAADGYDRPMKDEIQTVLQTPDLLRQMAITYGPRVLSAAVILIAGYFVMRWVARFATRSLARFPLEPPARDLILHIIELLVLLLFLLMALQNLGIDLLPLIAGLGIAGAGIALALQGVLGNVAAGLTIIFTRPFRVGEYISIAGEEGVVQTISLFSTTLLHSDLSRVVVPNRKIAGEILHNYGELRQLHLSVGVAYATDLDTAVAVVSDVLRANARVLKDPAPVVQASVLDKYAITLAIKPWVAVKDFGAAPGEINPEIVRAFRQRGIVIPLPTLQTVAVQAVNTA
jgi:small conductance mechanosensitive channel